SGTEPMVASPFSAVQGGFNRCWRQRARGSVRFNATQPAVIPSSTQFSRTALLVSFAVGPCCLLLAGTLGRPRGGFRVFRLVAACRGSRRGSPSWSRLVLTVSRTA